MIGGEEIIEKQVEEMIDEEELEEDEIEYEEFEEEDEDQTHSTSKSKRPGRSLTLKTLLKEGILEPGTGFMTINYLGNKFKGDLLPDGKIKSQETEKIFGTPSAWAIHCKRIVNPDKKSGCGWASVRYKGKKLDSFKSTWFRRKRMECEKEGENEELDDDSCSDSDDAHNHEAEIVQFDSIGSRSPNIDMGTLVELTTFQYLSRMQPFNITMSSSAMALIDVHAHLTCSEVVGYLAGQWDVNNHNLIVSHAFPARCRLGDAEKGAIIEQELYAEMSRLKLSLVGWYHTHPRSCPLPSLRDVDSQLDYEMKMKGYNDACYTPVLALIVSPYEKSPVRKKGIPHPNGNAIGYWVMAPPESKPLDFGRPMSMQFTIVQDAFIPKEALLHMSEVVKFYKNAVDAIELTDAFDEKLTYWHKLKYSLRGRVPADHFKPLMEFLTKVIDKKLPEDDPLPLLPPPPPESTVSINLTKSLSVSASHLPPATSITLVDQSKDLIEHNNPSIAQNLESYLSNILKGSIGADLIPITSGASSGNSGAHKEKDSVSITPTYGGDKGDHIHHSRPKSVDGRTPPPKAYSPLFQLPPPPLFSAEPSPKKDFHSYYQTHSKSYMQDENRHKDKAESRASLGSTSLSVSSSNKNEKYSDEDAFTLSSLLDYKYLQDYSNKSKKRGVADMYSGSSVDLSMLGKSSDKRRFPDTRERSTGKDNKGASSVSDLTAWFAHAKALQDAFTLPHERENPFSKPASASKDLSSYFSSPEFLTSAWNPTTAALHLSREASTLASLSNPFHQSLNFVASDSKPTYHSDVPFLLKKPEYSKESGKDSMQALRDVNKKLFDETGGEFKVPPDYKERRDVFQKEMERAKFHHTKEEPMFKEPKKVYEESKVRPFHDDSMKLSKIRSEESSIDAIRSFKQHKYSPHSDLQALKDLSQLDCRVEKANDFRNETKFKDFSTERPRFDSHIDEPRKSPLIDMREKAIVENFKEMEQSIMDSSSMMDSREMRQLKEVCDFFVPNKPTPDNLLKSYTTENSKVDTPVYISDLGTQNQPAMDMTFKIKRDTTESGIRHFIEPVGNKKTSESNSGTDDSKSVQSQNIDSILKLLAEASKTTASTESTSDTKELQKSTENSVKEPDNKNPRPIINIRDPKTLLAPTNDPPEAEERGISFDSLASYSAGNLTKIDTLPSSFSSMPSNLLSPEEHMNF